MKIGISRLPGLLLEFDETPVNNPYSPFGSRACRVVAVARKRWAHQIHQVMQRGRDPLAHMLVLLAREAGLRSGEMVALEWSDIDFAKGQVCVQRSAWKGQVASTKGGRLRYLPMTRRLASALSEHRHLRGPRVLYQDDGLPLTEGVVQGLIRRAGQRADYPTTDRTCSATRSALTSRCGERRCGQFRSWRDMLTSRRRSAICT
jgi:integrase